MMTNLSRNLLKPIILVTVALTLLNSCVLLDLVSPPCPGPREADTLEPNDTQATATVLNQVRNANINKLETDVFAFEASAGQKWQVIPRIFEGNGNDQAGLNLLIEGPNNFRLEKNTIYKPRPEFTALGTGTHFLTVTDGSRKLADCFVCTCATGRGSKYSLELQSIP
jgi:hypothetical protein